ncbi:MAG: D-alanyl-D-alanine carboxypeptidase [Chloroflexi bacterium]|nr:D-alanyl-D-alanine carboxypeptidase [Chloroflexota bacterium]
MNDSHDAPLYPYHLRQINRFWPTGFQGSAAAIMDASTGRIVWDENGDRRMALASITKIMTAIVALERGTLEQQLTIQPHHARLAWGSSLMGLLPGDRVSLEDLLWGLLLPSGNDAALAVADLVAGSEERFVEMMNDRAAELGMRDTHFANPHGLDEDRHFSTANDILRMTRHAMTFPLFARIVATPSTTRQASRPFLLGNSNLLVARGGFPGVDGVKSGNTDLAGDSLVASATRDGRRMIVVVLGTNDRTSHATRLLDFAFRQFERRQPKPAFANRLLDDEGQERRLEAPGNREVLVGQWERFFLQPVASIERPHNPYWPGLQVGRLSFRVRGQEAGELPLLVAP